MALLCAIGAIGYVALYSAGSGNPDLYATKHALRFGFCLVMMLCIGLVDIRIIARLSWVGYAGALALLLLVALHGEVGEGRAALDRPRPAAAAAFSELMKIMLVVALAALVLASASWERNGQPASSSSRRPSPCWCRWR